MIPTKNSRSCEARFVQKHISTIRIWTINDINNFVKLKDISGDSGPPMSLHAQLGGVEVVNSTNLRNV